MSIGKNTGKNYPFTQGDFNISLLGTQRIREALLARNLDGSYLDRGNPIPPNGDQQPGSVVVASQVWKSVTDSPLPEEVTDTNGIPLKETQFLVNKYGPQTGYGNPLSVNVVNLVSEAQLEYISPNTLQPQGFKPGISFDNFSYSNYTAIEVLQSVTSNNGNLVTVNSMVLDDSILIKSSFPYLKDNLGYNIAQFDFDISDEGSATLNLTTSPGALVPPKSDYLSRLEGAFTIESPIPGNYFLPVTPLDINRFQESMKLVAPTAKSVGESVQDVTAKLGLLAKNGISGSIAGTQLNRVFVELNKKGISLDKAMDMVSNSANKLGTATELVGDRGAKALQIFASQSSELHNLTQAFKDSEGEAKKMADIVGDTLEGDVKRLTSAWEGFVLSLDDSDSSIGNALRGITQFFTDIIEGMSKFGKTSAEIRRQIIEDSLPEELVEVRNAEKKAIKESL